VEKSYNGIIVVNKPMEMTSHDVVAIIRKTLGYKKIGHTGTLDPMATGVLPICIGNGTKVVDFIMEKKKSYICELTFGTQTDTQDKWGKVTSSKAIPELRQGFIEDTLQTFLGDIYQIPPMYSALKVNGQKLVDLARQGLVVDREPRIRTIYDIKLLDVGHQTIKFEVLCSKGTYIRTLCEDISVKIGTVGHMSSLVRTMSEPFLLSDSFDIEWLRKDPTNIINNLLPLEYALSDMPIIEVPTQDDYLKKITNGVKLNYSNWLKNEKIYRSNQFYRIYYGGIFYGIAEKKDSGIFMKKLFMTR